MKQAWLIVPFAIGWVALSSATAQDIRGAGSTFAYPIIAKWANAYETAGNIRIEYQPVGSSGGLEELRRDSADFAVSDAPLDGYQLLREGYAQFPIIIGAIVPVANLDGVTAGRMRFTGRLLADIYLGKITRWSDPAIAAINQDITLPDRPILVVHRSDGSGTTFNWTDYLSKVSGEWKAKIGAGTNVAWPTGVGGKGNSGVVDSVSRVKGAIGYVELGSALRKKLSYGLVENRAGKYALPNVASIQAAAADADWSRFREFDVSLTDTQSADAYPIVAVSFMLVHRYPNDEGRSRSVLSFFRWALESGQELASSLDYLPLPPPVVQEVFHYWDANWGPASKGTSLEPVGLKPPG